MAAAAGGHEPLVRLLLASGADPSQQDERGPDMARIAMEYGQGRVAQLLAG